MVHLPAKTRHPHNGNLGAKSKVTEVKELTSKGEDAADGGLPPPVVETNQAEGNDRGSGKTRLSLR
jgi:hypothetical protein